MTQLERLIRGLEQVKMGLLKFQAGFPPPDELAWQQYVRRLDETLMYLGEETKNEHVG
jgi:hypothetical protein